MKRFYMIRDQNLMKWINKIGNKKRLNSSQNVKLMYNHKAG